MRKILIAALAVALFACNTEDKKETDAKGESKTSASTASMPFKAVYSTSFEMGDPKNMESVMMLWKAWEDGDLKAARKYFADSVHLYLRDGAAMEGQTDTVMANVGAYRGSLKSMKCTVYTCMPLKSTDMKENWVCIWGKEDFTDPQGKPDAVELQETWRFNKDGKVDLMYQYGKVVAAMK